jgi:hypothetical protein
MLPSGLVIAHDAYAGPAATWGFTTLTIVTGFCLITAARYAALGKYLKHKMWAIRSFILLVSPLILRLASGVLIRFDWESELAYSLNAWLSWILPLVLFESTAWFKPKRAMAVADTTFPAKSYRTTQVT